MVASCWCWCCVGVLASVMKGFSGGRVPAQGVAPGRYLGLRAEGCGHPSPLQAGCLPHAHSVGAGVGVLASECWHPRWRLCWGRWFYVVCWNRRWYPWFVSAVVNAICAVVGVLESALA